MEIILQLPVLLFSIIFHEVAHGWVADKCGDDTARVMGRLTFNPLPHIDLFGTILLPGLALLMHSSWMIGWAKPVPVNPYRLNNPDRDIVLVSLAGPLSNILLAVLGAAGMWLFRNVIPLPEAFATPLFIICNYLLIINIILPLFNLIPVPPLDGSKVLMGLLPSRLAYEYSKIEPYGFIIIILLLSSGALWGILGPIAGLIIRFLGG